MIYPYGTIDQAFAKLSSGPRLGARNWPVFIAARRAGYVKATPLDSLRWPDKYRYELTEKGRRKDGGYRGVFA